jgi:hypothetical protein
MYIKTTNGAYEKPYSIGQLRKDNPNTSFPKNPTVTLLAEWGVYPVTPTSQPSVDHTKNVTEKPPVKQGDEWVQVWEVLDATESEIQGRIADKANAIRAERDRKLVESDWTQVLDAAVDKAAWATYRQALRDIPQQEGFPATVVWPTQPV